MGSCEDWEKIFWRIVLILTGLGLVILLITGLVLSVNFKVAQNEYAVKIHKFTKAIDNDVLDQGTYNIVLGEELVYFTSTIQSLNYHLADNTGLECFSRDGMKVFVDLTVQYLYQKEKIIPQILRNFKDEGNYMNMFKAIITSSLYKACALFDSEQYYTSRQDVENEFALVLKNETFDSQIGIVVGLVQMKNIDFPSQFDEVILLKQQLVSQIPTELASRTSALINANTTAINAVQTAQQNMIRAQNTKNIVIAQANATADVIKTQFAERAKSFLNVMTNLKLNSSGFVDYITSEILRLAKVPYVQL